MREATRSAPAALAALLAVVAWAPRLRADATSAQKGAAQALFEQGRTLVEQGHFGEACPKLAESQRLDPGLGTLLWLADCYENNGQTASAWATFKEASAVATRNHDDREKVARDRAQSLESRLSKLTILVPVDAAASGAHIQRDGVDLGPAEWGVPLPMDPGAHSVAASAPGHAPWSTTVQLPPNAGTLQVTVPALDALPTAAAATGGATAGTEQLSGDRWTAQRVLGLATAGLGVVALGAGTAFSLRARSIYDGSTSDGHCTGSACDGAGKQERSDAFAQATLATVALGLGAAALVGGGLLYFLAPKARPAASVGVVPWPGGASIAGAWRW